MKRLFLASVVSVFCLVGTAQPSHSGYPITPGPFTAVQVQAGTFWGQRLEASRNVTIPLAFSKCESERRYTNFRQAAEHLKDSSKVFDVDGVMGFSFDDTDPYKTLEGASYLLQTFPDMMLGDRRLDDYCDEVIAIIASAQEPDGYLYTARTQNPEHPHGWSGSERWSKVEDLSHELYNLGHLCEAAVAHYQATGKRNLLDVACRFADCVVREVGPNPVQACVVPGHQIAEMGLAKLYLATGKREYLDEARFFLDMRGRTSRKDKYSQAHLPVTEQDEAVGHAVRAGYMYAGMADVAALTGDESYVRAIDRIWENIVSKKFYITGGVGARHDGEAFGDNYELPNASAYCETCAAIAQVYLNYRLFLMHGESKYFDALERTLYNGVISGISIDGGRFYYPNPLASNGEHERQPWFGCACCPSNAARFIPSLPQYIYAVKDKSLFVNLFAGNTATIEVGGKQVTLEQQTAYPWDGDVRLNVKNSAGRFALKVRIPGWVRGEVVPSDLYSFADGRQLGYSVKVNGKAVRSELRDGYFVIDRKWRAGDCVEVHFDMEPRLVRANENVEADRGRLAVERGPLVYCAEQIDNSTDLAQLKLSPKSVLTLGKTTIADTEVYTIKVNNNLTLIPYYAWAHRGKHPMAIWLTEFIGR